MVYVSHHLNEIVRLCDRVTVIRDGLVVGERKRGEYDGPELVQLLMGTTVGNVFPEKNVQVGETVLEVRRLSSKRLRDISFDLKAGEVLGQTQCRYCSIAGPTRRASDT